MIGYWRIRGLAQVEQGERDIDGRAIRTFYVLHFELVSPNNSEYFLLAATPEKLRQLAEAVEKNPRCPEIFAVMEKAMDGGGPYFLRFDCKP